MTPSERERRIEAGIYAWLPLGTPLPGRRLVTGILDAADEAVPMVPMLRDGNGLIDPYAKLRDRDAELEDLVDELERAEAAARDFAKAIRRWLSETGPGMHVNTALGRGMARQALARWPSFSGEEGTEG